MAKLSRTKELWHIPKRGSVHQTIGMVHILAQDKFRGKSWSSGKQEALITEMGKVGLTRNGRLITHQSIRTLLANLPKYLGFVYIDQSSTPEKIIVTDVGYELIRHHDLTSLPVHNSLSEYESAGDLIKTSEVFRNQMAKLVITNPQIRNDCKNILVFPFRMTLKLLLELDYLDMEEIGYILFHTKSEDAFPSVIERIRNFRTLQPAKRQAEIDAYKATELGSLTLVKAPTANYYISLCLSTGLCNKTSVHVNKTDGKSIPALALTDSNSVEELLATFASAIMYDFNGDLDLWNEYFSNPQILFPPFDISVSTELDDEMIVIVKRHDSNTIVGADSLSKHSKHSLVLPVFGDAYYNVTILDPETGNELYEDTRIFKQGQKTFRILLNEYDNKLEISDDPGEFYDGSQSLNPSTRVIVSNNVKLDATAVSEQIEEMFSSSSGFDEKYESKLNIILNVFGKNYLDGRRRGGRLEFLYFELLRLLEEKGTIDEVFWYGKKARFGICEPAPGGKEGNPDIVFEIDNYSFVLELTTIRGNRAQWDSSEASSVPDHFSRFKQSNPRRNVVGIFSAPSIHHQLERNLRLAAQDENMGMIFKPSIEFAQFLAKCGRQELLDSLISEANLQIGS